MVNLTSASSLIKRAEDARLREAARAALQPKLTDEQLNVGLKAMASSKVWWLDQFSTGPKKRLDHEIEARRHELAVLVQAAQRLKQGDANADPGAK